MPSSNSIGITKKMNDVDIVKFIDDTIDNRDNIKNWGGGGSIDGDETIFTWISNNDRDFEIHFGESGNIYLNYHAIAYKNNNARTFDTFKYFKKSKYFKTNKYENCEDKLIIKITGFEKLKDFDV